ncbi:MAG: glycosyltransferase [Rhodospirillaceae bacterium]|nr:glycosyltransferase [Rhodospirillaceae bacterium]
MPTPVSIIVTAHNYAKYLPRALDSALSQNYAAVEVVVVDDGSTDETPQILLRYEGRPGLKIVRTAGIGLAAACNRGIAASTGEYIVRLDADDWYDENLALVLATYLDRHPDIGLVFCDLVAVDSHGDIIERVRHYRVNEEVELLDRSAPAAGAMYRRPCFDAIGGYNESIRYQEDYDFWIKFIEKFQVRNVSLPLYFRREHGKSMSRNWEGRMETRRAVKHRFVAEHRERFQRRVLAVLPARADRFNGSKLPLLSLENGNLLARCIDKLRGVEMIERIVVSTDDAEVADAARAAGAEAPFLRSKALNSPAIAFEAVLTDLLHRLQADDGYQSDLVLIIHPTSPFIRRDHVVEALDTLLLYDTDSVVAVVEDLTYHWKVGRFGLMPVGYQKRVVRQDRDVIYREAGGLYALKAENLISGSDLFGRAVGHIELAPYDALRIATPFDYWTAQHMTRGADSWQGAGSAPHGVAT